MNVKLAREIYGMPWYMDSVTLPSLSAIFKHLKNGKELDIQDKNNTTYLFDLKAACRKRKSDGFDDLELPCNDSENDENICEQLIAVHQLNGAITKNGGASSCGTVEIASRMLEMDASDCVIGHILYTDSGGGSTNAIPVIADAIKSLKKPIVGFISDCGASAAYYINSYCSYIIAERSTNQVGSIGTMIQIEAKPKVTEDKTTCERSIRIYASKSTEKNAAFEAAINDLNFDQIRTKLLDPFNERFIADIKANRKNVRNIELTGEIFDASDVVGTLIDEIGNFDVAINKVIELSNAQKISDNNQSNNNQKNNIMNKQELKAANPDLYAEILLEGKTAEYERITEWKKFESIDADLVKAGIESGNSISTSDFSLIAEKQKAAIELAKISTDNTKNINTGDEKIVKSADAIEAAEFEAKVRKTVGLKIK